MNKDLITDMGYSKTDHLEKAEYWLGRYHQIKSDVSWRPTAICARLVIATEHLAAFWKSC